MGLHGGFMDDDGSGNVSGSFKEADHPRDAKGEFASKPGEAKAADAGAPATGAASGAASGGNGAAGGAAEGASGSGKALPSLARPGFHQASPAEAKARGVPLGGPKSWTDVWVSDDPTARVQVLGRDRKGRQQMKYSAAHMEAALLEKHERGRMLATQLPAILYHLDAEIRDGGKNAEPAAVLRLIQRTGMRVGGDEDTGAEEKAYGATTLEARHVRFDGDTAVLDFVGKKGKPNVYRVSDPATVADLRARVAAAGGESGRLFRTDDRKVLAALRQAAGGQDFKTHDLRTWKATQTALAAMEGVEAPKTPEEYWQRRDEVGQAAANQINDTLAVALETYVDPLAFDGWRTAAGVPDGATKPARGKSKVQGPTSKEGDTESGGEAPAKSSAVHAAGVAEAMALSKGERDRLVAQYEQQIRPADREKIDAAVSAWRNREDTHHLHLGPDGRYTPERLAVHNDILARPEYFGGDRGVPAAGEQPEVVLLAGAPASGKGGAFRGQYDESKYLVLNADDFKERLPEYDGLNAALVHEESSRLMERALARAQTERRNIIIDGTLANSTKWGAKVDELRGQGYRVAGYHVAIPLEANLKRAMGRYLHVGRYVPLAMIAGEYNKYQTSFSELAQAGHFDRWAKFDNNTGGAPRKIAEGTGAG